MAEPRDEGNYHIHTERDLSASDLLNRISQLDLERFGLMELKLVQAKEGETRPNYFTLDVIRRKLYEFYVVKREVPTLRSLLRALKEELDFKGSTKRLRKMLRKDGFRISHQHRRERRRRSRRHCRCLSYTDSDDESEQQQ